MKAWAFYMPFAGNGDFCFVLLFKGVGEEGGWGGPLILEYHPKKLNAKKKKDANQRAAMRKLTNHWIRQLITSGIITRKGDN